MIFNDVSQQRESMGCTPRGSQRAFSECDSGPSHQVPRRSRPRLRWCGNLFVIDAVPQQCVIIQGIALTPCLLLAHHARRQRLLKLTLEFASFLTLVEVEWDCEERTVEEKRGDLCLHATHLLQHQLSDKRTGVCNLAVALQHAVAAAPRHWRRATRCNSVSLRGVKGSALNAIVRR